MDEAIRCLDRGARGIKLHPRAQRFLPDDPRLEPVFAVASARKVPILIHGGRGLPDRRFACAPGRTLLDDVDHRPRGDRRPRGAGAALQRPQRRLLRHVRVGPLDLLDLYRLVSPQQVLYASDYPYGRQPNSLLMAIRTARASGLDNAEHRTVLAESAQRIADGLPPLPLAPPRGQDEVAQPVTFARASTSTSRWRRRCSGRVSRTRSACSAWR